MTTAAEGHAMYKQFELRRAGHAKEDHEADAQYLDLLRFVEGAPGTPLHRRPARKLTDGERQLKLEGKLIHADVWREDQLLAFAAQASASASADTRRRAAKAEREVDRLRREAKRFDTP